MKTVNYFSALFLLILLAPGCSKNDSTPATQVKEPYGSMKDFFAANGAVEQVFTLSADQGGTLYGQQGTIFTFPPQCFMHYSGTLATGSITIIIREVYKKSDMLFTELSTTTKDMPLLSGGMFYVMPYQGSEQLAMADGKSFTAEMPANNPDTSMMAYILKPDTDSMNWTLADTTAPDSTFYGYNNSYYGAVYYSSQSYIYTTAALGWHNSDTPYFNTTTTNITMPLNSSQVDSFSFTKMTVYVVFHSTTSIIVDNYDAYNLIYNYPYAPLGYDATLVAIGLRDSTLYSAFVPFTITANLTVPFTLSKTTTDSFKAAVDALN